MKLELYQRVFLRRDLPEYRLKRGDLAMLIDYVPHPSNGEDGYVLEVFDAKGDSLVVIAVPMSDVECLPDNSVLSVRSLVESK